MGKLFSSLITKYWVLIGIVGTLLGLVGAYYTVQLYCNLRTDMEELLPSNARSIIDLNEVTRRLDAIDNIVTLVFSKDKKASKKFIDDLADRLSHAPKSVISGIEYKIDREIKFFSDRRALLMERKDLDKIDSFLHNRMTYERELYNPLNIFSQRELEQPKFDFNSLQKKYEKQASVYSQFPGGYYSTPDESVRILVAYMPGKGIGAAHQLRETIDRTSLAPYILWTDLWHRCLSGEQGNRSEAI